MAFHYSIESVSFSGGASVQLPRSGIALLVGPNNVGKSKCLREIAQQLGPVNDANFRSAVVTKVVERREGSPKEADEWLAAKYAVTENGSQFVMAGPGFSFSLVGTPRSEFVRSLWHDQPSPYRSAVGGAFVSYLDTETRLRAANAVKAHDPLEGRGSEALHALYESASLEDSVSSVFRRAFGQDLVVDRLGGGYVSLRVGVRPDESSVGERLSIPYGRAARGLIPLDSQGDGVRSYVACILHTDVLERPVLLLDEPETFLHPPQARILAQHLATSARTKRLQVIAATHTSDVVRGVLDVRDVEVSVIRLTRDEKGNHALQLDPSRVRELWADPLLRASNLLDALFHDRLVLCEADGDCRFYNAVLEAMCDDAKTSVPNVMFANTGGKARLHVAAKALVALGVPVTVIADLDVLSDQQPLRNIWEALGRAWTEIEALHHRVKAAVDSTAEKANIERVRERFDELIGKMRDPLDAKALDQLRAVFRAEGGWGRVKHDGLDAFPKGKTRQEANELVAILASGGLHVVSVGELEGFIPTIGRHGPTWVVEALERDLAHGAETARAREFVRSLGLVPSLPRRSGSDPSEKQDS